MWRAASRVLCRRTVRLLSCTNVIRLLCLALLSGVVVIIATNTSPRPRQGLGGRPAIRSPEIAFHSHASVYRQNAAYVTPLPRGNLGADVKADVKDVNTASPSQQRPPRGVHTRARRQEALEEEIERYLAAHGIHRERRTRVRFQVVTNYMDFKVCLAVGSAALGGYSIPVTGFDAPYSHVGRHRKYVEVADREGLDDGDIVVTMDSDVFWTGADLLPFLSKFARFSPEKEADLDVAAVRAWEDYGEKKAPLFMKELQAQAEAAGGGANVKRPALQLPPIVTNAEPVCMWGQHSEGFVGCHFAYPVMDHLIEVARNGVSSYNTSVNNSFIAEAGDALRSKVSKMFPGRARWMADDMLRQPNASSPYTTRTPRDRDDPLFYHPSVVGGTNPTRQLNGGMQVSRVWALRRLATMMETFERLEKPVPEDGYNEVTDWRCDQGMMGEMYTRARLFEVEHNLLSGPPLASRTPLLHFDSRFGPPGLIGVDRRSELAVLASALPFLPEQFRHSAYLNWSFPARGGSGANTTEARLGSSDPQEERLSKLHVTRSGVLVTPPLLWRSASVEERSRGYENAAEGDPDVIYPPFIHYAGGWKKRAFVLQRHLFSWLVAARHDRRARQGFNDVLREELIEVWYENERVYLDFLRVFRDPTKLPLW